MLVELFNVCLLFFPAWVKSSQRARSVDAMPAFSFYSSCKHHPQQLEPGQWEGSQKHIRKWKANISSCTAKTCTDWWVNRRFRLSSSKKNYLLKGLRLFPLWLMFNFWGRLIYYLIAYREGCRTASTGIFISLMFSVSNSLPLHLITAWLQIVHADTREDDQS